MMKSYICHKIVEAARIQGEHKNTLILGEGQEVLLTDSDKVRFESMASNSGLSVVDGYFVMYKDGYVSWSPADVFEKGYTELSSNGGPTRILSEISFFLHTVLRKLVDIDDAYRDVINSVANMSENIRYEKIKVKEEENE